MSQAVVTATNTDTGVKSATTTNGAGFYNMQNLPIGGYTVEVEHPGFRTYLRKGITITTGQALGLDVQLQLWRRRPNRQRHQRRAGMLETRNLGRQPVCRETKSVQDLPPGNRRTLNIVELTGAAVFVAYQNNPGVSNPAFSLAGGRSETQNSWLDGGNGQNVRSGLGAGFQLDPPVDAIAEVKELLQPQGGLRALRQ